MQPFETRASISQQTESPEQATPGQNRLVVELSGPSKNLTVRLNLKSKDSQPSNITMGTTIVKTLEAAETGKTISGETTLLYLNAAKIGLEAAKRDKVKFRWQFMPTDPEGKMLKWKEAHLDTGTSEEIKTFVSKEDVPKELDRIKGLLLKFGTNIAITSRQIENLVSHEGKLDRQIDKVRKIQDPLVRKSLLS
jgi:hypothetical protein